MENLTKQELIDLLFQLNSIKDGLTNQIKITKLSVKNNAKKIKDVEKEISAR